MQQPGVSLQYGAPQPADMAAAFASGAAGVPQQGAPPLAETVASSVATRAPPQHRAGSLDDLAPRFPDEEDAPDIAAEEAERGGAAAPGNRWPRQETLALLKIRSDMDAAFRDATLKAPLWEEVARKLAELGYNRSAKKCKEKFENVHKYYKRTKDGRAGRQDGKSYRFFSQLEALHSTAGGASTGSAPAAAFPMVPMVGSSAQLQPTPLNSIPPNIGTAARMAPDPTAAAPGPSAGFSFSATSSSSASESEEDTEEGLTGEPRKRKRRSGGSGGGGRKMMAFFEELMRQVMERQEAMQQRFLEAIEKREQDRMVREEAWKRQEAARISRENEMMAQERALSASRDAAIIAFLQKLTGQTVPMPEAVLPPQSSSQQHHYSPPAPVSPPPPEQASNPAAAPQRIQDQSLQQPQAPQLTKLEIAPLSTETLLEAVAAGTGGSSSDPASSRWPKPEVHALIKLRSELETRYQEAGPKGPLWEEIASRMQRLGYNRSAKRCKEKWENINKYFKKVKESNKKRPEDSKTCPYFHQLDALYRKKLHGGATSSAAMVSSLGGGVDLPTQPEQPATEGLLQLQPPPPVGVVVGTAEGKSEVGHSGGNNGSSNESRTAPEDARPPSSSQNKQNSNNGDGGSAKKPEGIVRELMDHRRQPGQHQLRISDFDGSEQQNGEDDEVDEEMEYRIHYQHPVGVNGAVDKELAAAASSFMAII